MATKRLMLAVSTCIGMFAAGTRATDDTPRACCLPDGTCQNMPIQTCVDQGGAPGGDATSCAAFICGCPDQPLGCTAACCWDDATCFDEAPQQCLHLGGTPQAEGSSCSNMVCQCVLPVDECAFRACCFDDGTCTDLPWNQCLVRGGANGGYGTSCAAFICGCPDEPLGCTAACCFDETRCQQPVNGFCCFDESLTICNAEGGTSLGAGTTCATDACGEEELCCRVTGGGNDCINTDGALVEGECSGAIGRMKKQQGVDTATFGGQAGAPASVFGEWTHVNHSGPSGQWTFHAGTHSAPNPETYVNVVTCSDEPACVHAAANGLNKQIDFSGVGTFKNVHDDGGLPISTSGFYPFRVHIEDLGEPGNNGTQGNANGCSATGHSGGVGDCDCPDFYHIEIDLGGGQTYTFFGYIRGGNLQMHDCIR